METLVQRVAQGTVVVRRGGVAVSDYSGVGHGSRLHQNATVSLFRGVHGQVGGVPDLELHVQVVLVVPLLGLLVHLLLLLVVIIVLEFLQTSLLLLQVALSVQNLDLVLKVDLALDHVQVLPFLLMVLLFLDLRFLVGLVFRHVLPVLDQVTQLLLFLLLSRQHIPLETVIIHCLLHVTLLIVVLVIGLFDSLSLLVPKQLFPIIVLFLDGSHLLLLSTIVLHLLVLSILVHLLLVLRLFLTTL